ncbi:MULTISPECIES: LysR family transcriptional regulator [Rhizobiaceae]|uniref:LysR family transcriptional regulator n=1 Tax=Rhizobiaceae TaxID=82115 RepID=UPI000FD7470B|nr:MULTISPECIES: LysR family transcriptional regulator [Rhizobiaceae]MBY3260240.1 LysR family transcriptional regulator [Rhizobium laguerreae]MBY3335547.1 LysR family transcriptional regulator [Rhizobium laguerreae]RVM18402.1 LysR family transcriptional regulator [Sinorhizobium meliloti]RVO20456.1 LysR family transcriptional regulator [Sinorhizobium meliloti]
MTTTVDFLEMQAFIAVVTEGSFTAAAERLETDKARVSRIVRRMEEKLGARLLNRSTRHLSVTEVGRDYFERASSILAAAEAAESAVAQRTQEPKGRLKITAGAEFGTMRVDGWIAAFLQKWPKVTVEAEYTNRLVDIIHEGVDVAIRIGPLQDSELSARRLGELTYGLYASPEYLRGAARILTVEDLKRHDLIMHAPRGRPGWTLVNGEETEKVWQTPRCALNNTVAAMNLALSGLGIVQLPRYMAERYVAEGGLAIVLPGWARIPVPVHAVFASTRYMDPKVRGFVDLCRDRFTSDVEGLG